VAGFDSDMFTVTANGWVQSKTYGGTTSIGIVPTGGFLQLRSYVVTELGLLQPIRNIV